jgi:hypothetical protein
MSIVVDRALEHAACSEPSAGSSWRLGIVADSQGHVHLGAVLGDPRARPRQYVDVLAPAAAAGLTDLHLEHLVVLVHGTQLAQLRQLAERCIDDACLRQQLVQLADVAASL